MKKIQTSLIVILLLLVFFLCSPEVSAQLPGTSIGSGTNPSPSGGVYLPTDRGLPSSNIKTILSNALSWILGIVGVVALISFAISGIQYMLSFGDDDRMKTAKQNMYYSIIGIVVALSGFIAVQAIDAMLNARQGF